jgi:hypothetical protein
LTAVQENVRGACIKGGFNTCLNNDQLGFHNSYRMDFKETKAVSLNEEAAKEMHKLLSGLDTAAVAALAEAATADKGLLEKSATFKGKCTETVWTVAGTSTVAATSEAIFT